jgi:hypothetical protein
MVMTNLIQPKTTTNMDEKNHDGKLKEYVGPAGPEPTRSQGLQFLLV